MRTGILLLRIQLPFLEMEMEHSLILTLIVIGWGLFKVLLGPGVQQKRFTRLIIHIILGIGETFQDVTILPMIIIVAGVVIMKI